MANKNTVPASFDDLMTQKKALAHLATLMPDGTPQVTPVWFEYTGDRIRVNSARGRVKDRNMQQNAAVALSIVDPDNAYRHVAIRGRIAKITEEGADAHIDLLAKKYLGADKYPFARPGEVRAIYEIVPISVATMG
jgi:PPOX class probable F420-dependent enzyme